MINPPKDCYCVFKTLKHVIDMRKTHHYLWILFALFLLSCENREEMETQLLINDIFNFYIEEKKEFYFSEDADTKWTSILDSSFCSLKSFLEWSKRETTEGNEIKIEEVFSHSDFKKICRESTQAFKFTRSHVPKQAKLYPQEKIDKWGELDNAFARGEVVLTEDQLRQMLVHYYRFSKPVFLKNYKYAFIYYSNSSFSRMYGSSAIWFMEKVGKDWKIKASFGIYMA